MSAVAGAIRKISRNFLIIYSVKDGNIKLSTVNVGLKVGMIIPKLKIIPREVCHHIHYSFRWKVEQFRQLLDCLNCSLNNRYVYCKRTLSMKKENFPEPAPSSIMYRKLFRSKKSFALEFAQSRRNPRRTLAYAPTQSQTGGGGGN